MAITPKTITKKVLRTKSCLAGMELADTKLGKVVNYGTDEDPLTVVSVTAKVTTYEANLSKYNKAKKDLDDMQNELLDEEAEVASVASRVLSSAKGKFKNDSSLVEMVGGVRTSDRKSPKKKPVVDINEIKKAS